MRNVIETVDLDFSYGKRRILSHVNLHVPENSVFGFLGENGSGKSTTIRILLNLIRTGPGRVFLFGNDNYSCWQKNLARIGAIVESPCCYGHLTGKENLRVITRLLGIGEKKIGEVLEIVGLTRASDRPAKTYSTGMLQRLGIAFSLLNDPDLLILDEPTNGLDPIGTIEMRNLILMLHQEHRKTIFLSSHHLDELEKVATHIAVLKAGTIRFQGNLDALRNSGGQTVYLKVNAPEAAGNKLTELGFRHSSIEEGVLKVVVGGQEEVAMLTKALVDAGVGIYEISYKYSTLEEIFLNAVTEKQP